MKEKADPKGHVVNKGEDIDGITNPDERKAQWFTTLIPEEISDILPIMTHAKGAKLRISIPVFDSTELIATKLREKYPNKFRINLDVYRSLVHAGGQLFDFVFLQGEDGVKKSKAYQMEKIMEEVKGEIYTMSTLEDTLQTLLEGHLSHGKGPFSGQKIRGTIEKLKPLLSEEMRDRCDIFLEEELDSPENIKRVKERIRKREYRDRMKNIHLVAK
jgi:hypothetical protein